MDRFSHGQCVRSVVIVEGMSVTPGLKLRDIFVIPLNKGSI